MTQLEDTTGAVGTEFTALSRCPNGHSLMARATFDTESLSFVPDGDGCDGRTAPSCEDAAPTEGGVVELW